MGFYTIMCATINLKFAAWRKYASYRFATDKLPKGFAIITATDGGKLGTLGKQLDKKIGGAISKAMKIKKFKGKPASMFTLLTRQI